MRQREDIEALIEQAYQGVPSLNCGSCSGDCCVSPTMTAPEFIRIMHWAKENYGDQLTQIITTPSREHFRYADNAFCRFQAPSGLCSNYQGRALACRLHGHESMRSFASAGTEFCDRNPHGNKVMLPEQVEPLLENIRQSLSLAGIAYECPYFMLSLNLECWLDFAYHPEWSQNRPTLQATRQYLDKHLELPVLTRIPQHTTLVAKLNAIDKLFEAIESNDSALVSNLLHELQNDFPSCSSYFQDEAKAMEQMLLQNAHYSS